MNRTSLIPILAVMVCIILFSSPLSNVNAFAVTTPAVTTPAVTTPAVTTPAVTTPAVTTPAVTPSLPTPTISTVPQSTTTTTPETTTKITSTNFNNALISPSNSFAGQTANYVISFALIQDLKHVNTITVTFPSVFDISKLTSPTAAYPNEQFNHYTLSVSGQTVTWTLNGQK